MDMKTCLRKDLGHLDRSDKTVDSDRNRKPTLYVTGCSPTRLTSMMNGLMLIYSAFRSDALWRPLGSWSLRCSGSYVKRQPLS
jgi:hypothetical protein